MVHKNNLFINLIVSIFTLVLMPSASYAQQQHKIEQASLCYQQDNKQKLLINLSQYNSPSKIHTPQIERKVQQYLNKIFQTRLGYKTTELVYKQLGSDIISNQKLEVTTTNLNINQRNPIQINTSNYSFISTKIIPIRAGPLFI